MVMIVLSPPPARCIASAELLAQHGEDQLRNGPKSEYTGIGIALRWGCVVLRCDACA